ncbi:TonB-dependent receptor plug domain-containing protein [Pseudotenacibaculum haliotis]|uniref:TonB-dependent receptor plug domain-containing protein n=1 Tax=Pseudotenacibaculum haliotis TaxID=1862138 RepID=A0ABW5LRR3_9FLAO
MNKQWMLAGVCALGLLGSAYAQEKKEQEKREELDEIVIDSRFKIKKENSGKIVHKITPAVIEQNKGKTVVDLINRVAGIEINGNTSVFGQNFGYFVRGGRSNEVVILIDGLQVVNPLQNNFDLRFIDLEQVESIEISKGASSTLYGSGAATAVIDIRMKKAKEGTFNASVGAFLGTNQTQDSDEIGSLIQTNFGINGTSGDFNYLVTFSSIEADGMSAARDETINQTFNDDPFRRNNFDIRLGYKFSDKFNVKATYTINNFNNSFDSDSFTDGNNRSRETNYRFSLMPEYRYEKGTVNVNFAHSKFDVDRVNTSFPATSNGNNYMIDAFVKHNFGKIKLIAGINFQNNEIQTFSIPFGATELTETQFAQDPKTTITDPYANIVYISENGFNVNAGVRMNNHNIYGNHVVYNFNPSYRFTNDNGYTRVFGSYSTAFIAPSIQDLFSSFGNPELLPQESSTIEFGAEYKRNSFTLNAVFFSRDVENIIIFNSTLGKLVNGGDTKINGIEVNSSYDILENLAVNANYTYTKNDDAAIRIPKNKFNAGVSYGLSEKTNFALDYQYVSDRDDSDFRNFLNVQNVTLDAYSLLDFSATHELMKGVTLFGNVTNILNEDYQEIFGFSTRGRNYKLGFRFQF